MQYSQACDACRRVRGRRVPQLAVALQQLLCAFYFIEPARIAHVLVMEAVQVMTGIEYDKRIVKVSRRTRGLSDFGRMTETLQNGDKTGAQAVDRVRLV